MPDALFASAFSAWGSPVTWLEILAFCLSVAMVIGNQRQWIGAWPLAIAASLLYGLLFLHGKLYGEAGLQLVFIGLAAWGWLQWARGIEGGALRVKRLDGRGWLCSLAAIAVGGPLLGAFLDHATDSPLPYWDALPTVGSVVATVLLGRINAVSVGLFVLKGYWLTVLLYAAFIPLALWGWRLWRRELAA
jgi:nicotinamide mononucleotide transporter